MRVLFWTYPAAFQAPGGGETILLKTREHVLRLGVEVDLFDQWSTKLSDYAVVHCFHSCYPEFWETVRSSGAHLVVTPTHWPIADARTRLLRWLKRCGRALLGIRAPHKDIRYYYALADAILPSSATEAGLLARHCAVSAGKMTVVRNGVDARFFAARPDAFVERYGLRDFVLCVGRIMPRKNQLRIVRTLAAVDVPVVFIGAPDPDAADYAVQCRREATPNMHFLGWLDHESPLLPSALAAARVFLMPSEVDIAPVAALEAAAAGCRLVITPVGSAPEYYGEAAYYADPCSEADIRRKTLAAFAAGRPNGSGAYTVPTWDEAARTVVAVYRQLLERNGRAK